MIWRNPLIAAGPVLFALTFAACDRQKATVVPPEQHPAEAKPAVDEFKAKIGELLSIHREAEKSAPAEKTTASAAQIEARRTRLAAAMVERRNGAKQGDIFTPAVRDYFVQVLKSEVRGPEGKPARTAMKDGNPSTEGDVKAVPMEVNVAYPEKQPLSSVPPTLLLRLPRIPDVFDYRFVGRTLVLRDTDANLILDFIPDAVPQ